MKKISMELLMTAAIVFTASVSARELSEVKAVSTRDADP